MKRYVVGIDPDISSNAIAIWDRKESRWASVVSIPFEEMESAFVNMSREETIFYVEAGWKNQVTNFHRGHKFSMSEKIAMNIGMNHAVSMLTARVLRRMGWEVVEIAPVSKGNGYLKNARGWTKQGREYIDKHSGYPGKLNDDKRCAILITMNFR